MNCIDSFGVSLRMLNFQYRNYHKPTGFINLTALKNIYIAPQNVLIP